MKRRQALKRIVVVASGAVIFPACNLGKEPIPVYSNLEINRKQFNLIAELADAILPKGDLEITTPEPTNEFILNMVNDCQDEEGCMNFVEGIKQFGPFLKEKYQSSIKKLDASKRQELFSYFSGSEIKEKNIQHFLQSVFRYTKQHFTSSEYFLTKHTDWKFIPGDYQGCVPV